MRMVFVTGTLSGVGAERVLSLLSTKFAEAGNTVSIISLVPGNGAYSFSRQIKLFEYKNNSTGHIKNLFHKANYVRRIAREEKADVIISFMTGASIVAILGSFFNDIPVIACERNNPRTIPSDRSSRILRKLLFPFAEGFVFQTSDARDFFSKEIANRSVIIPNPVNPALCEPIRGNRAKRIVSVGRLEDAKNYPMAIRAFAEFHNTHNDYVYDIYGRGSKEEELRKLVSDLELQEYVHFKGFSTSVYEDIKDAQIFVLSSNYEGMPNSLMEAMALGIPSISTDHPVGGARGLIENEKNGVLVKVNDVEGLAKYLTLIADNSIFAEKLGKNALQIKETYSIEKISKLWEDYFKKIVEG